MQRKLTLSYQETKTFLYMIYLRREKSKCETIKGYSMRQHIATPEKRVERVSTLKCNDII